MDNDAKQEREGMADNSDTISRKAVIEAIASVLSKGERPFSPQAPLLAAIHAIPSQPQTDVFEAAKRDWEAIEEDDAESVLVDWALKWGDAILSAALRQPQSVDRKLLCAEEAMFEMQHEAARSAPYAITAKDVAIRAIELWEEGFGK